MNYSWPQTTILELFLDAEKNNSSSVELKTNRDAELFRFALHNFRRRNKSYQERFKGFIISIGDLGTKDETKLTVFKPIEVEIKKVGT